jgi:hypothetical protein
MLQQHISASHYFILTYAASPFSNTLPNKVFINYHVLTVF